MLSSSSLYCSVVLVAGSLGGVLLVAGAFGALARYGVHLRQLRAGERLRRASKSFCVTVGPWFLTCCALELAGVPDGSTAEAIALTVAGITTAMGIFGLALAGELLVPRRGIVMASAVAMLAEVLRVVPLSLAAVVSVGWRAMRRLLLVLPPPRRRLIDVNLASRLLPIPRPVWG